MNDPVILMVQGREVYLDGDMLPELEAFPWYIRDGYATTGLRVGHPRQPLRMMHRMILGIEDQKLLVDHRDGNPLNNIRANLRAATPSQNTCNTRLRSDSTSGYKGVSYSYYNFQYQAQIMLNGKRRSLGYHRDPRLAALVRDRAALELHGEFAGLNFPHLREALCVLPTALTPYDRDALTEALRTDPTFLP